MRVLIVDDEPPAQTALANILLARSDVELYGNVPEKELDLIQFSARCMDTASRTNA